MSIGAGIAIAGIWIGIAGIAFAIKGVGEETTTAIMIFSAFFAMIATAITAFLGRT